MTNYSISIVIPAFNVENYLKQALESIQHQTQLPDEIILIDDGSTDKTLAVAESFNFSVPYRIEHIQNAGQGNARNLGLKMALSKYIYFFDADDVLSENFIFEIKKDIKKGRCPDIILFSGESFDDPGYEGKRWVDYTRGFSGLFDNLESVLSCGMSNNVLSCSPCLYVSKKSVWVENNLAFGSNYLEDEAIFFPLLFSCRTFLVLDKVFFFRRNRIGSTMTIKPNLKHVDGSRNCIETALRLYQSEHLSKFVAKHIANRIEGYCLTYVILARDAGVAPSIQLMVQAILQTKNIVLPLKALLLLMRVNELVLVRKARLLFKKKR